MAKFRIVYKTSMHKSNEDVEAQDFIDEVDGEWITFRRQSGGSTAHLEQVLRVRSNEVKRIERVEN